MAAPHRFAVPLAGLLLALSSVPALAAAPDSTTLPVLRSSARQIDVRENGILRRGEWVADPAIALDEFETGPAAGPARVTFVSDRDSLTLDVAPGRPVEFVVLLGDSVRCRTRVTCRAGLVRTDGGHGPVEVPLRWSRNRKPTIRARINGSPELKLEFDSGAADLTLYRSGVRKAGGVVTDGETMNAASGGTTLRRTRRSNTLEIGPLRGEGIPLTVVESQPEPVDGIVGYRAFADRALEFDFERNVLVVHDSLPALPAGFTSLPLLWNGTLHSVNVRLRTARATFDVPFIVDTGLNGTFNLGAATAARLGLPDGVKTMGWTKGQGARPESASAPAHAFRRARDRRHHAAGHPGLRGRGEGHRRGHGGPARQRSAAAVPVLPRLPRQRARAGAEPGPAQAVPQGWPRLGLVGRDHDRDPRGARGGREREPQPQAAGALTLFAGRGYGRAPRRRAGAHRNGEDWRCPLRNTGRSRASWTPWPSRIRPACSTWAVATASTACSRASTRRPRAWTPSTSRRRAIRSTTTSTKATCGSFRR
ncbi:MAG: retropepsin-like domain-containing protein [Candidatus Eisenbacteria bacterium]|nr:retropepsin-like domain-containing protein [Candidatus Eisenbacteria bacterium]